MLINMLAIVALCLTTACADEKHNPQTVRHDFQTSVPAVEGTLVSEAEVEVSLAPVQNSPTVGPAVVADAVADPVIDLLDRLEASSADLRAFTADIRYEKEDALLGRKELRAGDIIYNHDLQKQEKSFAIRFEGAIVNGRKHGEAKHYIFNGRWLAEVDYTNKQFIKREIVPPGKQLDPLKLGEGPFPLPIGQKKADVLASFDVKTAELPGDGLLKDLQNVDGLALTPKLGTRESRDYTSVQLFYDRETLLPVGIVTVETNEERKVVRLLKVKRNPELNAEQTLRLDIREPDPRQWKIDVRPWAE